LIIRFVRTAENGFQTGIQVPSLMCGCQSENQAISKNEHTQFAVLPSGLQVPQTGTELQTEEFPGYFLFRKSPYAREKHPMRGITCVPEFVNAPGSNSGKEVTGK